MLSHPTQSIETVAQQLAARLYEAKKRAAYQTVHSLCTSTGSTSSLRFFYLSRERYFDLVICIKPEKVRLEKYLSDVERGTRNSSMASGPGAGLQKQSRNSSWENVGRQS